MTPPKKAIRIIGVKEITPSDLDGRKFQMGFSIGDFSDGNFVPQHDHKLAFTTSGTLESVWGQPATELSSTASALATDLIVDAVSENRLHDLQKIRFDTYSAPHKPPLGRSVRPGQILEIPAGSVPTIQTPPSRSFLGENISEIRDHINAISRDLLGDQLLKLPEERALFDMYKEVSTRDEFMIRIQSLAGLTVACNKALLGKVLNISESNSDGSLILLEQFLTKHSGENRSKEISDVFKNVNFLRQGYPTHADRDLRSYDFFEIGYPVRDYAAAWERILNKYFEAMKRFLEVMETAREKARKE